MLLLSVLISRARIVEEEALVKHFDGIHSGLARSFPTCAIEEGSEALILQARLGFM
jgi:hypothetical protein